MQDRSDTIGWNFDNSYTQLPTALFTNQMPQSVASPAIAILNHNLAKQLNIHLSDIESNRLAQLLSGNELFKNSSPIAQAYAGHQFGQLNMLGDGRAILLGEHLTTENQRYDIQLKGSGQTPYSRRGDGRATLSSMLREYLISEAMYHLQIPTSRSLAIVTSGQPVYREEIHQGAILTRVASSHIRVGTFEFVSYSQPIETLKLFTNYVINRHYPELLESTNPPLELLKTVMHKQIELIVNWMRVGFIHGVMNSDNMTISGETLDYGPCAFMNSYNPQTVFSSIDSVGRYAFGNQPSIVQWNMACFAQTLLPLIDEESEKSVELAQEVISGFTDIFNQKWLSMMQKKLGIVNEQESNRELVTELLEWMHTNRTEYTNTFLALQSEPTHWGSIYSDEQFIHWYKKWQQQDISYELMRQNNPQIIPRNHLVEEALEAASKESDYTKFNELLNAISHPYSEGKELKKYQEMPNLVDTGYKTYCGT